AVDPEFRTTLEDMAQGKGRDVPRDCEAKRERVRSGPLWDLHCGELYVALTRSVVVYCTPYRSFVATPTRKPRLQAGAFHSGRLRPAHTSALCGHQRAGAHGG